MRAAAASAWLEEEEGEGKRAIHKAINGTLGPEREWRAGVEWNDGRLLSEGELEKSTISGWGALVRRAALS